MAFALAITVGGLFAAGFYLLLRRNLLRLVFGIALLGQAVNLLIFTGGGPMRGSPPLIPPEATRPLEAVADPLPQALILTAIVIGFGLQAFALVLLRRIRQTMQVEDFDALRGEAEPSTEKPR